MIEIIITLISYLSQFFPVIYALLWTQSVFYIVIGQVLSSNHSDQKSEKLVYSFRGQLLPVNAVSAVDLDTRQLTLDCGSWNFAQKKNQEGSKLDPRHLTRDSQLFC